MPTTHIYLSKESYLLHQKLKEGEAGLLYKNALKEYFSLTDGLDSIKKQIDLNEQEENQVKAKLEFLRKKKAQLEKVQEEQERQKIDNLSEKEYLKIIEAASKAMTEDEWTTYKAGIKNKSWKTFKEYYEKREIKK